MARVPDKLKVFGTDAGDTTIEINGAPIQNATSLTFRVEVGALPHAAIELYATQGFEVELAATIAVSMRPEVGCRLEREERGEVVFYRSVPDPRVK